MMSMTAITIRIWTQPPVCGNLGLMFRPKKPSSQRINRITMIVHNMRFLLLNDLLEATRSLDRVAIDLTAQQDEDASRDGEDRQDHAQAT
jgi:hypothetical protein